jgi:predicted lipoprotein with Yx(FWY)xxD motif
MLRLRTLTAGIATTAVATATLALGGITGATAAHRTPAAPVGHGAKVSTTKTGLGTFLVGPNGRTLYLFEKDEHSTKSHCYKTCAGVWPPLLTKGSPRAGGKAKGSLLGTTKRKNGTKQVTYAGHPVYYYEADTAAGKTSGEGIKEFGAEWYVLNPKGHKIDEGNDG